MSIAQNESRVQLSFKVSGSLKEKIEKQAEEEYRSQSSLVRKALHDHIEGEK